MADNWVDIPIDAKLFLNLDEDALTRAQAAIENGFINEAGGHSRFPGLKDFVTLNDGGRAYVHDWRGDMIVATSNGMVYRVDEDANLEDVTEAAVAGGGRVIFAKGTDELLMAAGGKPVAFRGEKTKILSDDAPETTHIAFIDSYVLANEKGSGRFAHSNAGAPGTWSALDTFAADGKPDDIMSLLVTPFREVILAGPDSVEQFERLQSGSVPFFRRWSVGEGMPFPYTQVFADNAVIAVNSAREFVRYSGQTSQPLSDDIGRVLEAIDDWTDAWIGGFPDKPLGVLGQKFLILQMPMATNAYGTKGVTYLYDYKKKMWSELYGWSDSDSVPVRWPGWSHWPLWGKTFVGGEGKVYEFDLSNFQADGVNQRWLLRGAHLGELGYINITDTRMRVKRGAGTHTAEGTVQVRCRRDGGTFGPWVRRGLGRTGERRSTIHFGGFGCANTWQFEFHVSDNVPVELVKFEADVTPLE